MTLEMQYSKDGIELTEIFEGCKLTAYQDSGGVWTIGYGHTRGVHEGMTITKDEAESLFITDVLFAVTCVNELVTVDIDQHQFDALVDFVFNVGCDAFAHSTLLKCINRKAFNAAEREFMRWVFDNGKKIQGLVNRRTAELHEFTNA